MQASSNPTGDSLYVFKLSLSQLPVVWLAPLPAPSLGIPSFPVLPSPLGSKPSSCPGVLHSSLALHGASQCSVNCQVSHVYQAISPLEVCHLSGGHSWGGVELVSEHRFSDAGSKL